MNGKLFCPVELYSFLDGQVRNIRQNIQAGDLDDDIRKDPKNVIEALRNEYEMELVSISQEDVELGQTSRGSIMTVSFYTTFKGDPRLLEYHPSSFREMSVPGTVEMDRIVMEITGRVGRDDFKRMRERWRESLEYHSKSANEDVANFNRRLPVKITRMVEERLEQIRKMDAETKRMFT